MSRAPKIRFLGTGAAGGTPGNGLSRRTESSAVLVDGATFILVDVTRDLDAQASLLDGCDAVLLTHGHADAIGGLGRLRSVVPDRFAVPVLAHPATIAAAQRRFARLEHCDFREFLPGDRTRIASWTVTCREVPHASGRDRFPTVAWKLTRSGHRVVYASDVARPVAELGEFASGASVLVLDGATYRRRIFSHLRIDEDLPVACRWRVERILLTQIGRSAPPHEELVEVCRRLCERCVPAHDGMEVVVPPGR